MNLSGKKEPLVLFIGDMALFVLAIWLTLFLRYGAVPSHELFLLHFWPFSFLIIAWILIFLIVGLYEKHTLFLKGKLPTIILNAQIANSALAVFFFYFVDLGITPKRNLFIYLFVSVALILFWRLYLYPLLGLRKKQNAILIGSGEEMKELRDEVNHNSRYSLRFVSSIDLADVDALDFNEDVLKPIYNDDISIIAIDLQSGKIEPFLSHLYNLIFSKVRFVEMHKIYEDIFDRIPLSLVKYSWFLENISLSPKITYDFLKRVMDILLSLSLGFLSLLLYPFIFLAIKLEDGGPIFIVQDRVGKNNHVVRMYKFRSMETNDNGNYENGTQNQVTRVGEFLRKTRIDELPQLWNVMRGDISLIGPRPELPSLVKLYEEQVPYYNVRHLIKPGLSGWAQIHHDNHPHHGVNVHETKVKLSYDLYYIKNRSFILDLKIALRTIKTLFSRSGI